MNKLQKKDTFINRIVMITLVGIIAFVLSGCGTDEESKEASGETKEEIEVAVVQDYPPFEYKVDDELTGFDVELVEAVAEKADLTVNWEIMKFDGIIPALQANQVDAAVSAIGITEDRLEVEIGRASCRER